jgi:cytochrome c-type biogenesis protein CcsB
VNVTDLSVMTLWTATTLYAIAMVAYSVRLSRVAEQRLNARQPELVAVGAAGAGAGAESADAPPAPTSDGALVADKPALPGARARGIGRTAMLVGAVLHTVGVVTRGIDAGHVPFSNMYEFTISGALAAVVVFLVVQRGRNVDYVAPGVAGFGVVAVITALNLFYIDTVGLQPALDSYWLAIHVPIATIAAGIFAVSGIASTLQIARDVRDKGELPERRWGFLNAVPRTLGRWKFLEVVPSIVRLEAQSFRLNAVGFVLWTFTVMTGALWAEQAWGRFWGWDPKEVWSFVIWILYAAYLHARTTQGWSGRRAAYLALAGFVAIILNFTVVNLYVQGLHSYSGI